MNNNYSSSRLINSVKNTIFTHNLINDGDAVLVALSGGADSVCLLDALCRMRKELGITVSAAHLNHMIRGREADRDEAYAAEVCTKLGVPFYAERVDVPELSKKDGISEEAAGRKARYDFFKRLCSAHGYNKIATAHNRNDKAETVIMRILRGTGIDGLAAIKYKREDGVIRPLLDVVRCDIEKYCEENNLLYCTDSTNSDTEYTRNRVREKLIPFLEENFNPSIIDTLCTLSDNAAEDSDFINGYAKRLYNRINSPVPKRKPTVLDIESLKMLDECIFNRIIRITANDVMGDNYNLERVHIESVRSLLDKKTGASVCLPENLKVSVKYGWLEFKEADGADSDSAEFSYPVEISVSESLESMGMTFEITDAKKKIRKNQMIIDYDMIEDKEITVRNRRAGDRMVFFKDGRTRKIKDYLIDKKIPREERNRIPLLCADNKIIAIIGDRVAETYKIKENTKRGLVITYGAENENR